MDGDKLRELVRKGSLIGYLVPSVIVTVAYVELWPKALFWCSTDQGCAGGPHILKFSRMSEEPNQVNFYERDNLLATLAPYDEWPQVDSLLSVYVADWKRWNAFPEKKQKAEQYWSETGQEMRKIIN